MLEDEIAVMGSPRSLTVLPAFGAKPRQGAKAHQSVPAGTVFRKPMASKKILSWAEIVKK
jgi:hypothetical protein